MKIELIELKNGVIAKLSFWQSTNHKELSEECNILKAKGMSDFDIMNVEITYFEKFSNIEFFEKKSNKKSNIELNGVQFNLINKKIKQVESVKLKMKIKEYDW